MKDNELALFGGEKVKQEPFSRGKRFGEEELQQVKEALEQNTLFYTKGSKVKKFNEKFAKMYGRKYCVAVSSGTAAVHVGLAAAGAGPGDEVITSPITDAGSVIGILLQNAIPVFADLDEYTYNMDPESVEEKITEKTKAIVVVHLAGNPADMDAIMNIAEKYGIKVIEDCAQSYLCYYKGKLAGTIGDIGCFSLNDFKHISAGDAGMCIMNDNSLHIKASMFADKNYNRFTKDLDEARRIDFVAPNYRMSELQAAVAIAQLDKLDYICSTRRKYGEKITKGIKDLPGIYPPQITAGGKSSYWFYMIRINEEEAGAGKDEFAKALKAEGIPNAPGYIQKCVYEYGLFKNKSAYKGTNCPFDCKYYGKNTDYFTGMCPNAEKILETAIKIPLNEHFSQKDIDDIIKAISKVSNYYSEKI